MNYLAPIRKKAFGSLFGPTAELIEDNAIVHQASSRAVILAEKIIDDI
jgi:hypothetical protein